VSQSLGLGQDDTESEAGFPVNGATVFPRHDRDRHPIAEKSLFARPLCCATGLESGCPIDTKNVGDFEARLVAFVRALRRRSISDRTLDDLAGARAVACE